MIEDLKQYLDEMKRELRADLAEMETRIMQRVDGRIDAVEERMKEHVSAACEKVETTLLREFQKWGRTSDLRTNQAINTSQSVSDRLLAVEDRVTALERRR
jgi:CHASE3 domain sensor protein